MTREELDEKAATAAKGARCSSCGVLVLDQPAGIAYGWARFPGTGKQISFQFCHRCATMLKPTVRR